jgi:hypothetical protein
MSVTLSTHAGCHVEATAIQTHSVLLQQPAKLQRLCALQKGKALLYNQLRLCYPQQQDPDTHLFIVVPDVIEPPQGAHWADGGALGH